jgi:hypothetical protein
MSTNPTLKARRAFERAIEALASVDRADMARIFDEGLVDRLLRAIAPLHVPKGGPPYDYFERNKFGLAALAWIRHAITHNYSVSAKIGHSPVFVSPEFRQWFSDGVMFLQGKERFAGAIGLFQNGLVKFAYFGARR